jgi:hypothetical protein
MLKWFDTRESLRFGRELAQDLLGELASSAKNRDAKFTAKAEKALVKADRKVHAFTAREPMNFYKRSKLANTFLWALKDGGCPDDYANELTEWLTMRL